MHLLFLFYKYISSVYNLATAVRAQAQLARVASYISRACNISRAFAQYFSRVRVIFLARARNIFSRGHRPSVLNTLTTDPGPSATRWPRVSCHYNVAEGGPRLAAPIALMTGPRLEIEMIIDT